MKKLGMVCLIIVAVLVGGLVFRNILIKCIIERGVKATTGVGLSIKKMSIGLTNAAVDIRGLKLHNPHGFPEKIMMDAPQVAVDVKARDLLTGKIHLESVRLHVNEFIVIKNAKGDVNVNRLKPVKEGKEQAAKSTPQKAGKPPKIQIDYLEYSIGKVIYKDYSAGSLPKVQEFPINVNRKYTNITNPSFIASIIITDAVARTAVARLAGVDVSGVKLIVSDTLKGGAESLDGAAQEVVDVFKDLFN